MSSPKWSGKPKKYNPNRTFVMSESSPVRRFNPRSVFMPSGSAGSEIRDADAYSPSTGVSTTGANATMMGGMPGMPTMAASGVPATLGAVNGTMGAVGSLPNGIGAPGAASGSVDVDKLELLSLYHPPLHPLQYQTYAPTPFRQHLSPLEPWERRAEDFSTPSQLRNDLAERNAAILQVVPGEFGMPDHVHNYHSLVPLKSTPAQIRRDKELFGPDRVVMRYKAVSHTNARTYLLLRVDDFDAAHDRVLQIVNKWKRVNNASVEGLVEALTTLEFGTALPSLVVVYEFFPMSVSLAGDPETTPLFLLRVAIQLFSAVQAIHNRGLVCRGALHEDYVRVQQGGGPSNARTVRLSGLGVLDVLEPLEQSEERTGGGLSTLAHETRQDYVHLGEMLRRLSGKEITGPNVTPGGNISVGSATGTNTVMNEFIEALLRGEASQAETVIAPEVLRYVDTVKQRAQTLEETLALELENGRLVRLLCKLEFAMSGSGSEDPLSNTHALHLFRRYAFGQHTEAGKSALNFAHALASLNRLDAGVDENILLVSEDGKTRLIISYKELKQMLSTLFTNKVK